MVIASNSNLFGKITILVVICCCTFSAHAKYGGGSGTPEDPYQIWDANHMQAIGTDANDWDKHFILMADIDLSGFDGRDGREKFNVIAPDVDKPGSGFQGTAFTGVFNGNHHQIANFTYDTNSMHYIGIFGYVSGENAMIRDLGLITPEIRAHTEAYVGTLAGMLSGAVTNCFVKGGNVDGFTYVGGLIGSGGLISDCYVEDCIVRGHTHHTSWSMNIGGLVGHGVATDCYVEGGSVSGDHTVGGLAGEGSFTRCSASTIVSGGLQIGGLVGRNRGTISECCSTGKVTAGGGYSWAGVGGLVGTNDGIIDNSYSMTDVEGGRYVGGLVGTTSTGYSKIINCYSTGIVTGGSYVGGLVGVRVQTENSFWDTEASQMTTSPGGYGKTTKQMKDVDTFFPWGICGNDGMWTIDDGVDYPRLAWEAVPGEPIGPYDPGSVYGGGSGEPNDPYLIFTAEQLNFVGLIHCEGYKHFKLMADIDLLDYDGQEGRQVFNTISSFGGVFDGDGHTISNFTYTPTGTGYTGLFGYVTGNIKDLGLVDPNIDARSGDYVGSLVGRLTGGKITNCYVEGGSVSGSYFYAGGLVGYSTGTISNCCSKNKISGVAYVGGLVGKNVGIVTNCYSEGDVSGNKIIGGLAGNNEGSISNCYSTGSVAGDSPVGGLVGMNFDYHCSWGQCYSYSGTITNCYSTGSVSGNGGVGGLVGSVRGTVNNSFWNIETSGQTTSNGGTGKTTAEMQTEATFIEWVCEFVWTIDDGNDYPRLAWQNLPGVPIGAAYHKYGGGCGTEENPYLIWDANHMQAIGADDKDWDKHFKLVADIDLSGYTGTEFNMIGEFVGYLNPNNKPFTGIFDGNNHTISNFTYDSNDRDFIGLFGYVESNGEIKDLFLINPYVNAGTGSQVVGSLVSMLGYGTITNCYVQGGSVSGESVGGLVGFNLGTITNCYFSGYVNGAAAIGGLVGFNLGTISNCYSTGSITGDDDVGGLVGYNSATINNCYSSGSVRGKTGIGGLVGYISGGTITNCYSTGSVTGDEDVGGLLGYNEGTVFVSFWDIETSGQNTSTGGIGLPTAEMQMQLTFTDAGWDFNTPVWTIDEGVDYPRLWWEYVPVLHAEPEVTLGISNTISWEPVVGDVEYYAECSDDTDFNNIVYSSGWIIETSCEFTGLELDKSYFYSVKARNSAGVESQWSNVESSLQGTLANAVEAMLEPEFLKNENMKNALLNKIDAAQKMIEQANYTGAFSKLEQDILQKTDGCADSGRPDKNDWITTCEQQSEIYPLIIETIEHVKALMAE